MSQKASKKLFDKKQAALYLQLGFSLRNILWDGEDTEEYPSHAWLKGDRVIINRPGDNTVDWHSLDAFKAYNKLRDGWYICELQSS